MFILWLGHRRSCVEVTWISPKSHIITGFLLLKVDNLSSPLIFGQFCIFLWSLIFIFSPLWLVLVHFFDRKYAMTEYHHRIIDIDLPLSNSPPDHQLLFPHRIHCKKYRDSIFSPFCYPFFSFLLIRQCIFLIFSF